MSDVLVKAGATKEEVEEALKKAVAKVKGA